ncbi:MAG: F0F1 ATP synthase subunit epsilon [Taibaiella sp.]|nr:F0F1 ATP synthase subunit epsilon [Taibaiella sp.]
MHLKILLPFMVFLDTDKVIRIVAESVNGSFGILPKRLDCAAALVPGILIYETESQGVQYLAVDEGILVKMGQQVMVSVRNAIGGSDLGKLRESVDKEFKTLDAEEINVRSVMVKMESGFIQTLQKLRND